MKCIVIYYSQTGNTKKIAEAIHSGMNRGAETSDIAYLRDIDPKALENYDLIGIGAPVWYGREPRNVGKFIEDLPSLEGRYGFVFCTHGTMPGDYISNMVQALRGRGIIVSGWNDWFGSLTDAMGPKPYYTDGHPDEIDLNDAEYFGREILERSKKISEGASELIPELLQDEAYNERYGFQELPPMPEDGERDIEDNPMKVDIILDVSMCQYPKCTICVDNCPTQSIDPSRSTPHRRGTCESCMFCEQICPTGAIGVVRDLHMTIDPSIFIKAAEQLLKYKELRRFRPLVPFDEVRFDGPGERIGHHPKLNIRGGVGVPRKTLETG